MWLKVRQGNDETFIRNAKRGRSIIATTPPAQANSHSETLLISYEILPKNALVRSLLG